MIKTKKDSDHTEKKKKKKVCNCDFLDFILRTGKHTCAIIKIKGKYSNAVFVRSR